jgi:hypothetical protein
VEDASISSFLKIISSVLSRKGAETQRNSGQLGMTFRHGGLALRLPCFAACPAELRGAKYFC